MINFLYVPEDQEQHIPYELFKPKSTEEALKNSANDHGVWDSEV